MIEYSKRRLDRKMASVRLDSELRYECQAVQVFWFMRIDLIDGNPIHEAKALRSGMDRPMTTWSVR